MAKTHGFCFVSGLTIVSLCCALCTTTKRKSFFGITKTPETVLCFCYFLNTNSHSIEKITFKTSCIQSTAIGFLWFPANEKEANCTVDLVRYYMGDTRFIRPNYLLNPLMLTNTDKFDKKYIYLYFTLLFYFFSVNSNHYWTATKKFKQSSRLSFELDIDVVER